MFILKFTIATIIFYIWFSYDLDQIGRKNIPITSIDYLNQIWTQPWVLSWESSVDQDIQQIIQDIRTQQHQASDVVPQSTYAKKFQDTCTVYKDICNKIIFQWDISIYDQYAYLASITYIISQLDTFLKNVWLPLIQNTIKTINISATWWSRRWWSTWDTMYMNTEQIQTYAEFFEVFTHELWHIVDLGVINGVSRSKDKNFTEFDRIVFALDDLSLEYYKISWKSESIRSVLSQSEDFCSGYGMTNPFEDFAECFNLYLNHNSYFVYLAKNNSALADKYNFFANIFDGYYLFWADIDLKTFANKRVTRRPRDTTRMR